MSTTCRPWRTRRELWRRSPRTSAKRWTSSMERANLERRRIEEMSPGSKVNVLLTVTILKDIVYRTDMRFLLSLCITPPVQAPDARRRDLRGRSGRLPWGLDRKIAPPRAPRPVERSRLEPILGSEWPHCIPRSKPSPSGSPSLQRAISNF